MRSPVQIIRCNVSGVQALASQRTVRAATNDQSHMLAHGYKEATLSLTVLAQEWWVADDSIE